MSDFVVGYSDVFGRYNLGAFPIKAQYTGAIIKTR
jgi:hypothetical protein